MQKKIVTIIILVILLAAGFYFFSGKIASFKTTDFNALIEEIKKDILAPPPLTFLGPQNNVVLTASKVIEETNIARQENGGLTALKENTLLNEAALAKANDMFKNQYFEHESPSGVGPGDLVMQHGYSYLVEGENLILGNFSSEKEVVAKWMGSPGHRENILNIRYTEIGVAVVKGQYQGETVWIGVQEFGLPASACPKPSESLKNQIIADKVKLDSLTAQINQKKTEINNTPSGSSKHRQLVEEYNNLVEQYNNLVNATKNLIPQYNSQVYTYNHCVGAE